MKLKSGWGMTETCSPGTAHPLNGPDKPGSIGLMLPGIEMDVVSLEDSKKVLPPGEVGEIRIQGPNVTKGYWNRPKETAEAFVGDRFLTGDIGYMDSDGYFYLVDRKKDMIISGGFNVFPSEVEQVLWSHPAVQDCAVIGVPDEKWGEAVTAVVVLRSGAARDDAAIDAMTAEIQAAVKDRKGSVQSPKRVVVVDALPLTGLGKPDKKAVRAQFWAGAGRAVG